jgi:phosphate-selective porin
MLISEKVDKILSRRRTITMQLIFRYVFLISITLLAAGTFIVQAQQKPAEQNARPDMEALKLQFEQQKSEIQKLRDELRKESELREQQQALLEKLADKLDKMTAASAASTPAPDTIARQAAPVPATTVAATGTATPKQADKPSNAMESGLGKVKFTGLIQGWFAAGNGGFADTFRLRRSELRFSGEIMPKVKWSIMFDLAKALSLNSTTTTIGGTPVVRSVGVNQASRVFQEAYITLGYFKHANIQLGQYKIPLSQEGLQSSAALDTVERALFMSDRARGGVLGDVRDLGLMAFGPLGKQVEYQVGVFNGLGETQNDVDSNNEKAFAGRLVFHPTAIKGLQIGGSGAWAPKTQTVIPLRQRLGFEAIYQREKLRLKSEFMLGVDGDIHRRGYYAHAGYRFMPKVEGIFRFDMFDPDTGRESTAATATERDYIGGINYYIKENNFKLQFNYVRKTFTNNITPSRDLFIVNLQTAW